MSGAIAALLYERCYNTALAKLGSIDPSASPLYTSEPAPCIQAGWARIYKRSEPAACIYKSSQLAACTSTTSEPAACTSTTSEPACITGTYRSSEPATTTGTIRRCFGKMKIIIQNNIILYSIYYITFYHNKIFSVYIKIYSNALLY